jgi:hypothetical protein
MDDKAEFDKLIARKKELNEKYPELVELIKMEIAMNNINHKLGNV